MGRPLREMISGDTLQDILGDDAHSLDAYRATQTLVRNALFSKYPHSQQNARRCLTQLWETSVEVGVTHAKETIRVYIRFPDMHSPYYFVGRYAKNHILPEPDAIQWTSFFHVRAR